MVWIVALLILGFAMLSVVYASQLNAIRQYLRQKDPNLHKAYSLDTTSLMLGTEDVEWNFQQYIFRKQYREAADKTYIRMCDKAFRLGWATYGCGIGIIFLMIVSGALSST